MIKAGIYTRISTDDQSDYSLDKQERDCRAGAARRGWRAPLNWAPNGTPVRGMRRFRPPANSPDV